MKIKIAWIGKTKEPAITSLTEEYLKRIARYVQVEGVPLRDEAALLATCGRAAKGGAKSTLVLMDSRGKEFSSEQFAKFLGDYQDRNPLPLVLCRRRGGWLQRRGPSGGTADDFTGEDDAGA